MCGGYDSDTSCLHYGNEGWTKYSWNLQQRRGHHISWRRPNGEGVQLFGGEYSGKTSEIVTPAGSKEGFDLKYDTK